MRTKLLYSTLAFPPSKIRRHGQADELFDIFDEDGSGSIEYSEMSRKLRRTVRAARLHASHACIAHKPLTPIAILGAPLGRARQSVAPSCPRSARRAMLVHPHAAALKSTLL